MQIFESADRVKTDMRVPRVLDARVRDICAYLGIPRNAFYALAAAFFVMELSPLLKGKKRSQVWGEIKNLFDGVLRSVAKHTGNIA